MDISIDRKIPVPINTQIKGQIEYGIAYGTLERGSRLPNVRELAKSLQVSPVTVSQAYNELRELGIITSMPGRGTFVSSALPTKVAAADKYVKLRPTVQMLVTQARNLGINRDELLNFVAQQSMDTDNSSVLSLSFIGIFPEASEHYTREIRKYLGSLDEIDVITFDALRDGTVAPSVLASRDALLTFAHRISELEAIVSPGTLIIPIHFIPSEETRTALAAVSPLSRVGLVTVFPEFLAVLKNGVASFAPHLTVSEAAVAGSRQSETMPQRCNIIIYASGSELGVSFLTNGVHLIEYLHTPDPTHLIQTLAPLLMKLRSSPKLITEYS